MGLFVTETRAVILASLAIVMTETVGISGTAQGGMTPLPIVQTEQVAASENRELRFDLLVSKGEAVGVESDLGYGINPLTISFTDQLKVWEWRTFPLGEHEVYGVPVRVFMKGRA